MKNKQALIDFWRVYIRFEPLWGTEWDKYQPGGENWKLFIYQCICGYSYLGCIFARNWINIANVWSQESRQKTSRRAEVSALHRSTMLTGAWLSSKHNSWWSKGPEVEPRGAKWPAHSFTGSLWLGTETSGILGSCRRAWLLFKLWKNLEELEEERGSASRRHNSRCSAGDA